MTPQQRAALRRDATDTLTQAGADHVIDTVADLPALIDRIEAGHDRAAGRAVAAGRDTVQECLAAPALMRYTRDLAKQDPHHAHPRRVSSP